MITISFDEKLIPSDLNKEWTGLGDAGPYIGTKNKFKTFVQDVGEAVLSLIYYNPSIELMARSANDERNSPALRLANYILLSEIQDLRRTGVDFVSAYRNGMEGKNVRSEVLASYDIMSGGTIPTLGDWTDNLNSWMQGNLTNPRAVPVAYVMALLSNKMHQQLGSVSPTIVVPSGTFDIISNRVTIPYQHMQLDGQILVQESQTALDTTKPKGSGDQKKLDKYGGKKPDSEEFPWGLLIGGLAIAGIIVYFKVKGDSNANR